MASSAPRFLADENFNNDLLRALVRRLPDLDIVRAGHDRGRRRQRRSLDAFAPLTAIRMPQTGRRPAAVDSRPAVLR